MCLRRHVGLLPRPLHHSDRSGHGPGQGIGHPRLVGAQVGTRGPWFPRPVGLLLALRPQLRRHRGSSDGAVEEDGFAWSGEALKAAVTIAPVLALPDFSKPFVVECDASTHGFGAMLLQEKHPIAFFSRPIAPRHRSLAAYERELIGLVHAVRHWRPYLWGRHFTVRTDHYYLKFLLDQRLTTIPQHHWVRKLLGFDFEVEYKLGTQNVVVDALSRRDMEDSTGVVLALSAPRFDFIDKLRQAHAVEPALVALREEILEGTRASPWAVRDGLVTYAGRLYIAPSSLLLLEIMAAIHDDGHEGV